MGLEKPRLALAIASLRRIAVAIVRNRATAEKQRTGGRREIRQQFLPPSFKKERPNLVGFGLSREPAERAASAACRGRQDKSWRLAWTMLVSAQ